MPAAFLTLALIRVRVWSEADGAFTFAGFARESNIVLRVGKTIISRQGEAQCGHAVYQHESGLSASLHYADSRNVKPGILAIRLEVMIVLTPEHKLRHQLPLPAIRVTFENRVFVNNRAGKNVNELRGPPLADFLWRNSAIGLLRLMRSAGICQYLRVRFNVRDAVSAAAFIVVDFDTPKRLARVRVHGVMNAVNPLIGFIVQMRVSSEPWNLIRHKPILQKFDLKLPMFRLLTQRQL
jgi:hypothetical protein